MKNKTEKIMLSEHFSLWEMTRSGVAIDMGISNMPDKECIERLRLLCENVLEPLRCRFGAIIISSGYRCERVNDAVGGAGQSQHLTGEAADIHVSDEEQAMRYFDFIRDNTDFDQLLLESKLDNGCCWIHVSYTARRQNRRMAIADYEA